MFLEWILLSIQIALTLLVSLWVLILDKHTELWLTCNRMLVSRFGFWSWSCWIDLHGLENYMQEQPEIHHMCECIQIFLWFLILTMWSDNPGGVVRSEETSKGGISCRYPCLLCRSCKDDTWWQHVCARYYYCLGKFLRTNFPPDIQQDWRFCETQGCNTWYLL